MRGPEKLCTFVTSIMKPAGRLWLALCGKFSEVSTGLLMFICHGCCHFPVLLTEMLQAHYCTIKYFVVMKMINVSK